MNSLMFLAPLFCSLYCCSPLVMVIESGFHSAPVSATATEKESRHLKYCCFPLDLIGNRSLD